MDRLWIKGVNINVVSLFYGLPELGKAPYPNYQAILTYQATGEGW